MAAHREQIVAAAAKGFRESGFDGISVADIMEKVGLTQGGFYRHFSSKEELVAAAAERAFSEIIEQLQKVADEAPGDRLEAVMCFYLSQRHHDHPELGCPLAALGAELARQRTSVKEIVTQGENRVLDFLSALAPGKTKALRRRQAIVVLASMVGGMVLARSSSGSGLRKEVLHTIATAVPATMSQT
jgi:TetR/AcrR family transcriptional repressor of nem operon